MTPTKSQTFLLWFLVIFSGSLRAYVMTSQNYFFVRVMSVENYLDLSPCCCYFAVIYKKQASAP